MAGITPSRGIPLVRINAGTAGAITAGAHRDYNIVAVNQAGKVKDRIPPRLLRGTLRGTIEDVVAYWRTAGTAGLPIGFYFWGNTSHNHSNLSTVQLWGIETAAASEWTREQTGGTSNLVRLHIGGLAIPYADDNGSGVFHVTVENDGSTNLAAGKFRFEFGFRPEYGA